MTLRIFTRLQYLLVLRSGGQYKPCHVTRLAAQIRLYDTTSPIYCLTDMELERTSLGVQSVPLKHDWPGWWAKIEMFRRDVIPKGATLYLDLDTDVIADPRTLRLESEGFSMLEDFNYSGFGASGVMFWNGRAPERVYRNFLMAPEATIDSYVRMPHKWGDQAFIRDNLPNPYIFFLAGQIVSHKLHCQNGIPDGARIIAYHGRPKPWELTAS